MKRRQKTQAYLKMDVSKLSHESSNDSESSYENDNQNFGEGSPPVIKKSMTNVNKNSSSKHKL